MLIRKAFGHLEPTLSWSPELPGCMAHGATPGKAVENAQDAIDLWIEAAQAFGRTIPSPMGRRVTHA